MNMITFKNEDDGFIEVLYHCTGCSLSRRVSFQCGKIYKLKCPKCGKNEIKVKQIDITDKIY